MNSPALAIIRLLEERVSSVSFHDPLVSSLRDEGLDTPANELTAADCVVIATNHTVYNWTWTQQQARLVVDTRYALGSDATKKAPLILERNVGMLES